MPVESRLPPCLCFPADPASLARRHYGRCPAYVMRWVDPNERFLVGIIYCPHAVDDIVARSFDATALVDDSAELCQQLRGQRFLGDCPKSVAPRPAQLKINGYSESGLST